MKDKAMLIGFKNCQQTKQAYEFLKICNFDVFLVETNPKRGSKLPAEVKNWSGEYLFHLKSYCILRKNLLNRVSIAAINFHPCLPKYPGAGGVNWTLFNNDKETGVTVHIMNHKVDNGKILNVYKLPVFQNDTVESLMDRIKSKQTEAFYDIVGNISKKGKIYLDHLSKLNSDQFWGKNVGRIKDIDKLEIVDKNINKADLEKLIRATKIGNFGPKVILHGYTFQYKEEK